jgi:hypothetical protein
MRRCVEGKAGGGRGVEGRRSKEIAHSLVEPFYRQQPYICFVFSYKCSFPAFSPHSLRVPSSDRPDCPQAPSATPSFPLALSRHFASASSSFSGGKEEKRKTIEYASRPAPTCTHT